MAVDIKKLQARFESEGMPPDDALHLANGMELVQEGMMDLATRLRMELDLSSAQFLRLARISIKALERAVEPQEGPHEALQT